MHRLRTSYLDDWEDMRAVEQPRVRILGISFQPIVLLSLMIVAVILLVVVVSLTQLDWFSQYPALRWGVLGCCAAGMLGVLIVAVISARTLARAIHRSRMHLARLDGATVEEARRESDRFIRKNLYLRLGIYISLSMVLWALLGNPWVFAWGGTVPYLCGITVLLALFILLSTGLGDRILTWLRRRVAIRR